MKNTGLLNLRKKWFQLKAKEFILRYSSGFMVIAILLPGVAIGDNLSLILKAISKPFLIVSSTNETALIQLYMLAILMSVFIVWARAQREAISGGKFAQQILSLPINERSRHVNNIIMLLIANHFLWLFIIAGFYFLMQSTNNPIVEYIRYINLILLLFYIQYIFVFTLRKKNVLFSVVLSICLIMPIPTSFEPLRLILILFIFVYLTKLLFVFHIKPFRVLKKNALSHTLNSLRENLYIQMLFISGLSSTIFRLSLLIFFLVGFSIFANHFADLNDNNLDPYAFILEFLLAFYLSGFYLLFKDERKQLQNLMITLPLKKLFWPARDMLVVVLISLIIHSVFFMLLINYFNFSLLFISWTFHVFLLLLCFPLRTLIKKEQTFITFVTLLIITIVTIYNLS